MELGNFVFGNSRGEVSVNRDWQDDFSKFLNQSGFDSYGFVEESHLKEWEKTEKHGSVYFENEIFIVRPYYWGDEDSIAEKPNFVFKPTGFELSWYKFPLRDSYMSKDVDKAEFLEMLEVCRESLK